MLKLNYSTFGSIKLQWEVKGEGGEGGRWRAEGVSDLRGFLFRIKAPYFWRQD